MISPNTIAANVVTKLKLISTLVTALGNSSANIVQSNWLVPFASEILNLPTPGLLIRWMGARPDYVGASQRYAHDVVGILKITGDPSTALGAINDGVPTGQSFPMRLVQLSSTVSPFESMQVAPRDLQVGPAPTDAVPYIEIRMTFLELGEQ